MRFDGRIVGAVDPDPFAQEEGAAAGDLQWSLGDDLPARIRDGHRGHRQRGFGRGQRALDSCPVHSFLPAHTCRSGEHFPGRFFNGRHPCSLVEYVILFDQEAGVGRDDAIARAQIDDRLHQFGILAVQPDLLHQMANGPRGPEARDERLAAFVAECLVMKGVGLLPAVGRAGQRDGGCPALTIAPGHDQLRPGEQIGQLCRVDLIGADAAHVERDVGQNRRIDLVVERANGFVGILARSHIRRGAALILGQRIQQRGVHVVADAESEQTGVVGQGSGDRIEQQRRVGNALGGQAVGQEDNRGRSL